MFLIGAIIDIFETDQSFCPMLSVENFNRIYIPLLSARIGTGKQAIVRTRL